MFRSVILVAFLNILLTEISAKSCLVSDISLQEDFNPRKYIGTWYIVAHVQDDVYPYQRRSHYHLNDDMTFSMATQRIVEQGGCDRAWHFEATGWTHPNYDQPARMLVRPNIENVVVDPEDYWVISTDYINYALVYSCAHVLEDGSCDPKSTHAWIMSRSGKPLDAENRRVVANAMADELCIDIDRVTEIPTECDVQLGVPAASAAEQKYPNCITHLEAVMDNLGDISQDTFIPRCDDTGRLYRPLQCAIDGIFCWCVDQETGETIPNSRTRLPDSPLC